MPLDRDRDHRRQELTNENFGCPCTLSASENLERKGARCRAGLTCHRTIRVVCTIQQQPSLAIRTAVA